MMNNVNSFEAVRARVNLRAFLETELGARFEKLGGHLRASSCPACGTGGGMSHKLVLLGEHNEKWKCFSCGERGDVSDAAMKTWGISLRQALRRLATEAPPLPLALPEATPQKDRARQEAVRDVIQRIRAGVLTQGLNQQTVNYLVERGISERVVREGTRRGLFGALPPNETEAIRWLVKQVGRERMEAAGMWGADKRAPAVAYRPLAFFLGSESAEFRLIRKPGENERKALRYGEAEQPWIWTGKDRSKAVITEGAIDLLSMVELGYNGDVIGLPGASTWKPEWFQRYRRIALCLDPDKAGQEAATKILDACHKAGIQAENRPPKGGDVNEFLRQRKRTH